VTRRPRAWASARVISHLPQWFRWARDRDHAQRVAILLQTPVFAGLPRRLVGRLAVQFFEKRYAEGEVIFHQGDPGKGLFVVLDGEVEIVQETEEGERRLAALGPSSAFGELALIDDLPRSASVLASAPSRLLILYRSHFEALVASDRGIALVIMQNLLRTLAGYVRAGNGALPSRPKASTPAAPAGVDCQDTPSIP
jgi:CRP/FNR family transcriptional regulator, cyclic AMP receptor protein